MITKILLTTALMVTMFALGLGIRLSDIGKVFVYPRALAIALSAQFLLVPAVAFGMSMLVSHRPEIALGMIMLAAVPSGVMSNVFCYFARGDLALSVSLTAITQVIGFVSVPLYISLGIQLHYGYDGTVSIPVLETILTMFIGIVLPMVCGMALLAWKPVLAQKLEQRIRRIVAILLTLIVGLALWPYRHVAIAEWSEVGLLALGMAFATAFLSYAYGAVARLSAKQSYTVGIEVTLQNIPLATTIAIVLMQRSELATYPAIYAMTSLVACAALTGWYRYRSNGTSVEQDRNINTGVTEST